MSAEDKADLPEAMIEAAAKALADEVGAGYLFVGRYPNQEANRESFRDKARIALAAALSVCDVRPKDEITYYDDEGEEWIYVSTPDPDGYMAENPKAQRQRRLVITTPATEVPDVD